MIEILTESGYFYVQLLYLFVWVHIHHTLLFAYLHCTSFCGVLAHHTICLYTSAFSFVVIQSHAIWTTPLINRVFYRVYITPS